MGSLFSKQQEDIKKLKEDFTNLQVEMKGLQITGEDNSAKINATDERLNRLEKSHSDIVNALNGLTTRLTDISETNNQVAKLVDNTNKRLDGLDKTMKKESKNSEQCLEILQEETSKHQDHRLQMERMMANSGFQSHLPTSTLSKGEWIGLLPKKKCNKMVDEPRILHIRKCISPLHIKMVGRYLGLRDNEISEISVDYINQSAEVAYQIILKWKHKMGHQAKVKNLIDCLYRAAMEEPCSINVNSLKEALEDMN